MLNQRILFNTISEFKELGYQKNLTYEARLFPPE